MSQYANVVIRASAGTGKTFQLSNRFIGLLLADAALDEILATTFTRKAAAEILDRVLSRLADAALDEAACQELAEHVDAPDFSIERCRHLLAKLTGNLHRLRVGTLDSFFAQLASSFCLEIGLPPGWRIVDELEDAQLRNEAIASILREGKSGHIARLLHLMTKGQAERSVGELVRSTVNNLYDLYMVTSGEAWRRFPQTRLLPSHELTAAIEQLADFDFLEDRQMATARDKDVARAEIGDWEELIGRGLAAKVLAGDNTYYRKPIPDGAVRLYEKLLRHVCGVFVTQLAQQTSATHELLEQFATVYQNLKFDARAMRFEDLTRCLAEATNNGDLQRLRFRMDGRISHLLLDEFQDTSLQQWQVIRPFAQRAAGSSAGQQSFIWSEQSSLFCVGDVKQAIYGWRGGLAEIFDAMEDEVEGLAREALDKSFRSAQPIIASVNRIFKRLTAHPALDTWLPAVKAWEARFRSHSTAHADLPGYVELVTPPAKTDDESQNDATIRFAVDRIAEIVQRAPGATVGVLVRRNATVAQLIYELRGREIAASEEGGNPLTDSAAVQTVLSLLKVADHPGNTAARMHVAQSPLGAIVGLERFDDDGPAIRIARQVRRSLQTEGYGPTLSRWVNGLAPYCNQRDYSRLLQLVELAYRFRPMRGLRTQGFDRFIRATRVGDPTLANVRVMTIHQAKGLEFDVVVLPDLDADLIGQRNSVVVGRPTPTGPVDQVCVYRNASVQSILPEDLQKLFHGATYKAVAEALCVLYVAVTRATHALHMIVAPSARPPTRTFAGLLRASLVEDQSAPPETILFEQGDSTWYDRPMAPEPLNTPPAPPRMPSVKLAAGQRRRAMDWTSPSEKARGRRRAVADVLRIESAEPRTRGTLIHAWFQLIKWLEDGRPDDEALRRACQSVDTSQIDVEALIRQFHRMLDRPQVAAILSRDFYRPPMDPEMVERIGGSSSSTLRAEVHTERPFAIRDDDSILRGTIDRLVVLYDGDKPVAADIIDYKSDKVSPNEPEAIAALIEHYRQQLDAYRSAVSKSYRLPIDRITARLLFVSAGILKGV